MLKITDNMTRCQLGEALNVALLQGFLTETAAFPVIKADEALPYSLEQIISDAMQRTKPNCGSPLPSVDGTLFPLDYRTQKGLENLFCNGMFLKDTDNDFLPDSLDVKFVLPQNCTGHIAAAACNLAFRFGMETTAYCTNLLADENYSGNAVIFTGCSSPSVRFEQNGDIYHVYIDGCGSELEQFVSLLCEKFPLTGSFDRWGDTLLEITRDFAMETADGQLAYLDAADSSATLFHTPDVKQWQKKYFPKAQFCDHKDGRAVYSKQYDIPWEAETFRNIMEQQVYPLISKGDWVTVKAAVSENNDVRMALTKEIIDKLTRKGAYFQDIKIVNSYKQGFSWLNDIVVPRLKAGGSQFEKFEIYFKPFLPQDVTDWSDENGATPNRTRGLENNPDKWFDLPIRYLQELYPIDDIISQQLNIPRDDITFHTYDGDEDITYLVKAWRDGKNTFFATYKARCSERPYMDEYPQLGLVHPSTAYIEVSVKGRVIFETTFKTDLENVWDIWQSQVLPDCRKYIENKTGGNVTADMQPFFNRLELDISLSEEEYATGTREDIISPLSALHEDLYFSGCDYFKYYGQSHGNVTLDAPGLILPKLHLYDGKPKFTATLFEQQRENACVEKDGRTLAEQTDKKDISLFISRISMENNGLAVYISANGIADNVLKSYAHLWSKGVLQKSRTVQNCGKIVFVSQSGNHFETMCKPDAPTEKTKNISDINIFTNNVIGYDEYLDIINQLKQVKGIEVFPVAKSYMGRDIYAVWLKKEHSGYLSLTKYLTNRTGMFINARHHANEVSSTNAAFDLINKLLTDKKYADLADRLNLVIVPVENADGTAIHYDLQKEHPAWQLHTARFNALSKEFAYEYFTSDPLSREALSTSRIYSRFVPDIMVDNHGVPSHEWDQQFSGYTSPAYKGFWLPRSLLYGYFWHVKEAEYAANIDINKKMEAVIADAIAADGQMTSLNREWTSVFEKYAHSWMPKLFPAEYCGDMINYWIGYNMNPHHMYCAIRYPWLTSVAYTSEVADETAQGEYLSLCARAHLAHDTATIDMLLNGENSFEYHITQKDGTVNATYKRTRPVKVQQID